jgi:chromosome segregation ATPase
MIRLEELLKCRAEEDLLLEIKLKIEDLERQLSRNMTELHTIKENALTPENDLVIIFKKLSSAIKNLNRTILDLKFKMKKNDKILTKDKDNLYPSIDKIAKLKNLISEKDKEIEKLNAEIEQKEIQIEIDKSDLDHTILHKDKAIFKLISDLEKKVIQINEQKDRIHELEAKSLENQISPNFIKKIKEVMAYKGFITDKELEKIIEK